MIMLYGCRRLSYTTFEVFTARNGASDANDEHREENETKNYES